MNAPADSGSVPEPRPSSSRATDSSPGRPLLASEALRDDLAPLEPLATTARIVLGILAAACAATAGLATMGGAAVSPSSVPSWMAGVVALLAALLAALPMGYAMRATMMLSLAVAVVALAVVGRGPGFALHAATGSWSTVHAVALVALPAGLLFRARYRAYPPARWILLGALLLALPHVVGDVIRIIDAWELGVRIASAVALCAVLLSLLGFMGAETTGAGDTIAWTVTAGITMAVGSEILWAPTRISRVGPPIAGLASVMVLGLTGMVGALGAFGLMASRLAPKAREHAPHSKRAAPGERRRRSRQHSIGGWLSRR